MILTLDLWLEIRLPHFGYIAFLSKGILYRNLIQRTVVIEVIKFVSDIICYSQNVKSKLRKHELYLLGE